MTLTKESKLLLLFSVVQLVLVNLYPFVNAIISIEDNKHNSQEDKPSIITTSSDISHCTIYMAPSSIPNAGFGIFTTENIEKGQSLLPYTDAPLIPVVDRDVNGFDFNYMMHIDYLWGSNSYSAMEADFVSDSVVTFGAISNYHPILKNIKPWTDSYDDTMVDKFTSPGAGAFSYNNGHDFRATRLISAGEEIFADYGGSWLDTRSGSFADVIPRASDFKQASSVLTVFENSLATYKLEANDALIATVQKITKLINPRSASLLPKSGIELGRFRSFPSWKTLEDRTHLLAVAPLTQRNATWIKENGMCLDNMYPSKSSIPHAGRGAFARRKFPQGSRISPALLLQIMDKEKSMNVYKVKYDEEEEDYYRVEDESIGKQLLMNYCFGHKESSMLLCPQNNIILVNHCSDRRPDLCGNKKPNAKIIWAEGWDSSISQWLQLSIEAIHERTKKSQRGLSFDLVATRNIERDEEILIDYGLGWEEAWDAHVAQWKPPSTFTHHKSLKNFLKGRLNVKTVDEQKEEPYPENLMTVCYYYEDKDDKIIEEEDEEGEEKVVSGAKFLVHHDLDQYDSLIPCDVMKRHFDMSYTVRILPKSGVIKKPITLVNFPGKAITLRIKSYMTDQSLPNAFRHYLEINNEIFPEHWKDLK